MSCLSVHVCLCVFGGGVWGGYHCLNFIKKLLFLTATMMFSPAVIQESQVSD